MLLVGRSPALPVWGIGLFANIPALAFASLAVAMAGSLSYNAPFWTIPPMLPGGSAAAGLSSSLLSTPRRSDTTPSELH